MKKILHLSIILLCFSCSNLDSNKESNNYKNEEIKKTTIAGVYSYSDSSIESIVNVSENTWSGKLIIKSGFGSSYDNSNASYSSGIIRDGVLLDESGYIELGLVNGITLSIPIGSKMITHYK